MPNCRLLADEDRQAQAEQAADDADLDLGLLLVAGEGQQVEERDAEQDVAGEGGRGWRASYFLRSQPRHLGEAEPRQADGEQAGGQGEDEADAGERFCTWRSRPNTSPATADAAEDRREQAAQRLLLRAGQRRRASSRSSRTPAPVPPRMPR